MSRADNVATAQALRTKGLTQREIAQQFGVARSTVNSWLSDPDLSKQLARRRRYSRPCVDCGDPTDGSGGLARKRTRCLRCAGKWQHETRAWTPDRVVAALSAWGAELGRAPTADEARSGDVPVHCDIAQREFGSWNAAIVAAGLTPRGVGQRMARRSV